MNPPIKRFEDLIIWQKAMILTEELYKTVEECQDLALKNQMQRAAVSIPSNIAEGFERRYNKEFIRFLRFASASNAELRTQLMIAVNVHVINPTNAQKLIKQTHNIAAMLYKLINYRQKLNKK